MENYVVESRQPTESFFSSAMGLDIQKLIRSFALIRRCKASSAEEASRYYFLEHILRLTTSEEEFQEAKSLMKRPLAEVMTELHVQKYEKQQKVIHSLETTITPDLLKNFKPHIKINLFTLNNNKLEKEEMIPEIHKFPVCFIYTDKTEYHILYTPNMNMVDGYCTTTGNYKKPNNIPSLFKRISELFYEENKNPERKTIPKKVKENKEIEEPKKVEERKSVERKTNPKRVKENKVVEETPVVFKPPTKAKAEKKETANLKVNSPPKIVNTKKEDSPRPVMKKLSSNSSGEENQKIEKPQPSFKVASASDSESYEEEEEIQELEQEEPPKEDNNLQPYRFTIKVPPKEYKAWEDLERRAIQARNDRDLCYALSCTIQ